jgi:hypothetical protein
MKRLGKVSLVALGVAGGLIGAVSLLNFIYNACGLAGMRDCASGSTAALVSFTAIFGILALVGFSCCVHWIKSARRIKKV